MKVIKLCKNRLMFAFQQTLLPTPRGVEDYWKLYRTGTAPSA
jgi:hypothetical protein